MSLPTWPAEGGCRCGRVRFRLSQPPLMETACHCNGCKKMTASAFSTTLIMQADAFSLLKGETVIGGVHGDDAEHHHCQWCKSWIYTKASAAPQSVNVRATLLDDPSWFAPWMETQTAERLPWAVTSAERSFERFPEMGDYEELMTQYRSARQFTSREPSAR